MIAQKKTKKTTYRDQIRQAGDKLPEWWTLLEMSEVIGIKIGSLSSVLKRMISGNELERFKTDYGRYKYKLTGLIDGRAVDFRMEEPAGTRNIFLEIFKKGHDEDFQDKLPEFPTGALPGSPEKVEVMRKRVERGESPNHPGDLRGGTQLGAIPRRAYRKS